MKTDRQDILHDDQEDGKLDAVKWLYDFDREIAPTQATEKSVPPESEYLALRISLTRR